MFLLSPPPPDQDEILRKLQSLSDVMSGNVGGDGVAIAGVNRDMHNSSIKSRGMNLIVVIWEDVKRYSGSRVPETGKIDFLINL